MFGDVSLLSLGIDENTRKQMKYNAIILFILLFLSVKIQAIFAIPKTEFLTKLIKMKETKNTALYDLLGVKTDASEDEIRVRKEVRIEV